MSLSANGDVMGLHSSIEHLNRYGINDTDNTEIDVINDWVMSYSFFSNDRMWIAPLK